MLNAISPIDGRYAKRTKKLSQFFSEFALIKRRVYVEIEYFKSLCILPLPQLVGFPLERFDELDKLVNEFSDADAASIKKIESITNHDVKAVEYWIKERFDELGFTQYKEFVHFGLTSQDVNNTATPMLLDMALRVDYIPSVQHVIDNLRDLARQWIRTPMLARTHGQPASPTILGKEILVFVERLQNQLDQLKRQPIHAKFGGATGNFNAHHISYPDVNWVRFADIFVNQKIKLQRSRYTTQIAHYDTLAAVFDNCSRISTIMIDLCRDMWTYISMDYFKQKVVSGEVGSSAMPHKVNPIDFENAEGNLGITIAIFRHLSDKLPISRLQRDLTDSTVLRNMGVPFAHASIAIQSIEKGLSKLVLNSPVLRNDLDNNWIVTAEALQNILRREGFPQPYEVLKNFTRGKKQINAQEMKSFIDSLDIEEELKNEMKLITPHNYTGVI